MQNGVLDKYDVELLGAKLPSINRAEDRSLFKDAMAKIGLKTPTSGVANTWEEALQVSPTQPQALTVRQMRVFAGSCAIGSRRSRTHHYSGHSWWHWLHHCATRESLPVRESAQFPGVTKGNAPSPALPPFAADVATVVRAFYMSQCD